MTDAGGNNEQWAQTAMFTASEVEAQTGVAAATLRQWERRYGFPRPVRNQSGYRLYSPEDVRDIGVMLEHQRLGVSARRAAELTLRGVPVGSAGGAKVAVGVQPAPPAARPTPELAHALARVLIAADHVQAADLLAEAHARLPVEDVMMEVMSPALVEIGERWANGEITIAHERGASHFLRSRLSAMMDIAGVEESREGGGLGPLVVAACAPGEQHELGLMMLTLALRRRGVRVAYLGANVPLRDLAVFAGQQGAQAILVAVNGDWVMPGGTLDLNDLGGADQALSHLGLPVFVGGALMNAHPELAARLGGVYAGPDAPTAASLIASALGHRPDAPQAGPAMP